jgi:serine/threonine protein kinase
MSNLIGQSLGRYHILEQIGEGGMATVYKAYDTHLEREVAVKVIRTERLTSDARTKNLKRFEREAKALAKLTHPNIVSITDYGEFNGRPYLVMPYIPGGTLKRLLGKPIPWKEAARFLIPLARALQFAHQQRIIHRDIKPSNILVTPSGEAMLTDFGIAKILLTTEDTSDLTGSGVGIGTPAYMSPEQSQGKEVDERADIYSLGVVFYEMVTGRRPYTADTPAAILLKQIMEPLPRPSAFVPNLPERVEKTLIKALAKNPENRFQDMGEFIRAMTYLLERPETSENTSPRTITLDAAYDTFGTVGVKGKTTSTVDQKTGQHGRTQTSTPTSHPTWTPWAVGSLGLCVVGLVTIAVITFVATNVKNQPVAPNSSQVPSFSTLPPTAFIQVIDPSPLPTDTSLPPTDFPTLAPTNLPTSTNTTTCNPKYSSRLRANQDAWICTISDRVFIRTDHSELALEHFLIYTGTKIFLVDGPVCVEDPTKDHWWWYVKVYPNTKYGCDINKPDCDKLEFTGITVDDVYGWAKEGWDGTDQYFICQ